MIQSNVTWLQRLLSYVMEVPVITLEGEYNPTLRVSLVRNRFQLSTEHAIYSFDDYYLNFSKAFRKMDLPPDGAEMLLLGLGLGSVPYILEKQHHRKYDTTAVELDEAVIALASAFTFPRLSTRIEVVHADAEVYIQNVERSFDLIIVDLFLDDVIPPYFEQKEGLQQLRKLLKPAGLLLINRLYRNTSDRQKTGNFYRNTFLKVFTNGYHIEVMGNWILVGKG